MNTYILHHTLELLAVSMLLTVKIAAEETAVNILFLLVGLVVKAYASRAEDPGFESRLPGIFRGQVITSDLKIGTPVATLPGVWRYGVSAGIGWFGVCIQ